MDFFPPLVDDPYLFGQIAAVNALSDVYAMGGRPVLALNILSFPSCDLPTSTVKEILRGGANKAREAGAVIAGGHTIQGQDLLYGMSVMGLVHPEKILTNNKACADDQIILCKPIGTGVSLLGLKGGVLSSQSKGTLLTQLTQLNDQVLSIALRHTVRAATDITGFGLIGHLHEMAYASKLKAKLWVKAVPLLPDALRLAEQGIIPAAAYANRKSYEKFVQNNFDGPIVDLLFDPQTAGGLMLSIGKDEAQNLVAELQAANISASTIGEFVACEGDASTTVGIVELVN